MSLIQRLAVALALACLLSSPVMAEPEDFLLKDLTGREHRLSDYRGKWVVVNYWATWCPPCLEELPELEVFYTSNRHRATVLGVNLEDIDHGLLKDFVEEQFLSYPILRGRPGREQALGPVQGLPTSYLVSPKGEVVARQVGTVTAAGIQRYIDNYQP